jgi:predicted metal-dependent peptidase
VTVYLDVSGSMHDLLPAALDGLLHHAQSVRWPLWAFSTEVHAASLADLRAGRTRSTRGTDLRCVARHLAQTRARRALIVTDGDVGRVNGHDAEVLRATRLGVVLCGAARAPDLAGLGARVVCVPSAGLTTVQLSTRSQA